MVLSANAESTSSDSAGWTFKDEEIKLNIRMWTRKSEEPMFNFGTLTFEGEELKFNIKKRTSEEQKLMFNIKNRVSEGETVGIDGLSFVPSLQQPAFPSRFLGIGFEQADNRVVG